MSSFERKAYLSDSVNHFNIVVITIAIRELNVMMAKLLFKGSQRSTIDGLPLDS